ncbi:MAG: TRAP transporter large permease subunit [Clostridia bacterium]|nr:TRAP transporter large permease subunit [Clostridia bacterium]
MIPAIVLFALTYVLILVFGKYRTYIALASGLVFILTGMLPINEVLPSIDFNVILMIVGTMGLVSLFTESKMPMLLADMVMEKVPNVKWAVVSLALFAGIISAFVDNVATVLMVAPIALAICKKLDVNPVPFVIAIAVSSNLQGAATLVGDTTAIMLGSALDMSFLDFFWYKGRPSIFFAVELGALISALILLFIFRKENSLISKKEERTKVTDYVPTALLVMVLVLLITASFIPNKPDITNGAICCALLLIGLLYSVMKNKTFKAVVAALKEIDFQTIGILVGIFLMIGGISSMGVIDALANLLAKTGGGNVFLLYTVIIVASVIISAFIDNIPYVATMIPVIAGISTALNIDATPLYFGLLSGATLGGNCTPVGASANITGIGILKKSGYTVKNSDFFKIGIPFTIAAVVPAYIYIWLMYGV